ncbi:OsmC family protein [Columbia Basin potato purple top phytoplasma]|uniref:OsmC family protein n=1 Tax=Columbia Basin potato purple top phytoplasma TaxID=307134 RepID=A0ABT5L885_9MOLU|nr:OsmC family protein [Columbia Basin potato purple top phytoplasma]MDC9031884.1 OsmC family protein [Columbia Basin potato purple top phytoplasma]
MNEFQLIAYYETKFQDLGIIKNGLKTKLVSALMNNEEDYSSPSELLSLSLVCCFYKTAKKILDITKKDMSQNIKIKILCNTLKDQQGFYFQIDLFFSIKDLSLVEIKKIMDLTHKKCAVSRIFNNYPYINLNPVLFDKI